MSLRPIVCDFLSVVTLQSFLLGRFERLVFRPPLSLKSLAIRYLEWVAGEGFKDGKSR
jgi:hypothetical protein